MQYYHFLCPECGFSDKEAGSLANEKEIYCGVCAEDTGDDVRLNRWPEGTENPYAKASVKGGLMEVALLNTAIVTTFGEFSYQPLTVENAKRMIEARGHKSFIGHESTAQVLSQLLGVSVAVNREEYVQQGMMTAIVFKLSKRLDSPRELTVDEIDEIGYTLGTLYKIA